MRRRVAAVSAGRKKYLMCHDSVCDPLVPIGLSQASAELRSEDADTKSPGKSSTMLTRHAKVRGQKTADLSPKYA